MPPPSSTPAAPSPCSDLLPKPTILHPPCVRSPSHRRKLLSCMHDETHLLDLPATERLPWPKLFTPISLLQQMKPKPPHYHLLPTDRKSLSRSQRRNRRRNPWSRSSGRSSQQTEVPADSLFHRSSLPLPHEIPLRTPFTVLLQRSSPNFPVRDSSKLPAATNQVDHSHSRTASPLPDLPSLACQTSLNRYSQVTNRAASPTPPVRSPSPTDRSTPQPTLPSRPSLLHARQKSC